MRSVVGTGGCERRQEDYEGTCRRSGCLALLSKTRAVAMSGAKDLFKCPMDPSDHQDIVWLHTQVCFFHLPFEHTSHWLSFAFQQLTSQVNGLSGIYERIAYTIRELQDDKAALQSRIEELEQGDPSVEVHRLREENSTLRARLATAAKEKAEITWECDALLRKLNSIKLLLDGPAVRSFSSFHTLL